MLRVWGSGCALGCCTHATRVDWRCVIHQAAGALPWLVPGVVISALIGLVARTRLAGYLATNAFVAWLLVVSTGAIVFATLAPLYGMFEPSATGPGRCDFSNLSVIPLQQLLSRNERTLNIILFAPLGLALGLLPRSRLTAGLVLVAMASPFIIETTQLLLPILGRGCQAIDVIDNLTGLAFGLVIGIVARALIAMLVRSTASVVNTSGDSDAPPNNGDRQAS